MLVFIFKIILFVKCSVNFKHADNLYLNFAVYAFFVVLIFSECNILNFIITKKDFPTLIFFLKKSKNI